MLPKHVQDAQRQFIQNTDVIRGFICGLLPDLSAADDVFQEVFLVVSEKAESFELETDFMGWVRAIARNKVMQHYARSRLKPLDADVMDLLTVAAPSEPTYGSQFRKALDLCLKKLASKARTMLQLRYEQNRSPAEIATILNWQPSSVHVGLSRVRQTLRKCAEKQMAREAG